MSNTYKYEHALVALSFITVLIITGAILWACEILGMIT